MLGMTNALGSGADTGDLLCWYWGRKSSGSRNHPNENVTVGRNREYFSYDSHVFTVLKDFTGSVRLMCSGTRNGSSGSSGSYTLRLYFVVNGSDVKDISGITYTGNGTPQPFSHSFKAGDEITIEGYHSINQYTTDFGYFITLDG